MNQEQLSFQKHYTKNTALLQSINQIHRQCCDFDAINHHLFFDGEYQDYSDIPFAYTASIAQQTVGFLCPYVIDRYNVEFCLFVLPKYRCSRIGMNLFFQMVHDFGTQSFRASLHPDNEIGKAFLTQLGFTYGCRECSMALNKNEFTPSALKLELLVEKTDEFLVITGLIDDIEVGNLKLTAFDMTACIHDVEIKEKFRRNGYGFRLLTSALIDIFEKYERVILHVTKENLPAYRLYQKIGFKILEELDYYEL